MADTIIEVRNLDAAYNGNTVLQDVNLTVQRGDFLAIVGPNGGGKTTLLKCMVGLLKPRRGDIRIFGNSASGDGTSARNAAPRIGYVPQQGGMPTAFPVTVEEAVLMGFSGRKWGWRFSRAEREAAHSVMDMVGIADCARDRMNELSGGQRQRALIARALVDEPELLVFDEPTSNIDPQGRFCFYELLADIGMRRKLTIVVVSHDLSVTRTRVSAIACVNREVLHTRGQVMTPPMLELLYGSHEKNCPMDAFIQDVSAMLEEPRVS